MQCDNDLYAGDSNVMIKVHTAKESRLLLVGACIPILHNRDLQDTPSIRVSVVGMKMASINRNWLGFSTMLAKKHQALRKRPYRAPLLKDQVVIYRMYYVF
jgi:hypothetical protein